MREFVDEQLAPLKQRIAELEGRPAVKYLGVFDRSRNYVAGSMVTHSGSVWHANVEAKGVVPGGGDAVWTLAVKRGSR